MSADNCVAVASFPTIDGNKEYRVVHAQAIENCDDDSRWQQKLTDAMRVSYFGKSIVYTTEAAALSRAKEIYDEIMADDFCPICEYGIISIAYDRPFPTMTQKEAEDIQNDFYSSFQ